MQGKYKDTSSSTQSTSHMTLINAEEGIPKSPMNCFRALNFGPMRVSEADPEDCAIIDSLSFYSKAVKKAKCGQRRVDNMSYVGHKNHQFGQNVVERKNFFKTKLCPFNVKSRCVKGNACTFAHSAEELRTTPNLWKTKLCKEYKIGMCNKEKSCRFAHGKHELRYTDQFYKTTLCRTFSLGFCKHGNYCRFAHGMKELRPKLGPEAEEDAYHRAIPKKIPVHVNDGYEKKRKIELEKINHYRNFFGGVNRILDEQKKKAVLKKKLEQSRKPEVQQDQTEDSPEEKLSLLSSEKNSIKRHDSFDGENFLTSLPVAFPGASSDYFKSPIKNSFEKNNFDIPSTTENTPEEGKTFKSRIMVNLPNKLFNNTELINYKKFEQEKLSRYGF